MFFNFVIAVETVVGITTSVLVSQAHGAESLVAKRGWLVMALVAMTISNCFVALMCLSTELVLDSLTNDKELVEAGSLYAVWLVPAIFFSGYEVCLAGYLGATEHADYSTIATLIWSIGDIIITYILMFGGLGIKPIGNALIANAVSWNLSSFAALTVTCYFMSRVVYSETNSSNSGETAAVSSRSSSRASTTPTNSPSELAMVPINVLDTRDDRGSKAVDIGQHNNYSSLDSAGNENIIDEEQCKGHKQRDDNTTVEEDDDDMKSSSYESLSDWLKNGEMWSHFYSLVFPNLASEAIYSIAIFTLSMLAARLGRNEIAAHNTCIVIIEYGFSLIRGMGEATNVRMGYHVGAGNLMGAYCVILISLSCSACIGAVVASTCFAYRVAIAKMFTVDANIVFYIVQISPLLWGSYAVFAIGDQMLAILDGQGRAKVQTMIFFFGMWVVTIPMAIVLFHFVHAGLVGLWFSLLLGWLSCEVIASFAVYYSDWQSIIDLARDHMVIM